MREAASRPSFLAMCSVAVLAPPLVALLVAASGCDPGRPAPAGAPAPRSRPGAPAHAAPLAATALPPSVPGDGPIGSAHPTVVAASADDGRWVILCQARTDTNGRGGISVSVGFHGELGGDAMKPYLVRGTGDGIELDELVDTSSDGRWLAVVVKRQLVLVDDRTGQSFVLPGADLRGDGNPGAHRAAAFDGASSRLVYFRAGHDRRIVIRDLAAGSERDVDLPDGAVWRVVPDPKGPWARVAWIRSDSDGDGVLRWPAANTNAPRGTCVGPARSWSSFGGDGDRSSVAWIRLDTGELLDDERVRRPLSTGAVVRAPDGAIRVGGETWVPAVCEARVLAVSASPQRILVACSAGATAGRVALVGPGFQVDLGVEPSSIDRDPWPAFLVHDIDCLTIDVCYWVATGALVGQWQVVSGSGRSWFLRKGDHGLAVKGSSGGDPVEIPVDGYRHAQVGAMTAIGTQIIDLDRRVSLGSASSWPLAIDQRGRALVAASGDAERSVATGPLRWETPRPRPPATVPAPSPGRR